ncbi:hypothetical protein [Cellulophaga fucicola]|uniref:hypothetical protein n=1 Tax=Cellulophaga fucicola TaxID=76595 RepID=UPI003EBA559B
MKKNVTLILVTFFSAFVINAQSGDVNLTGLYSPMTITSLSSSSKKIEGSSYIKEDFEVTKLAENKKTFFLRYNAYKDEMEIKKDGEAYYLSRFYDFPITFLNLNIVYNIYDYNEGKGLKTGYFVELERGNKISLLLKQEIKFYEETKAKTGYGTSKPPKLERQKDRLFYSVENNIAKELPRKKKEILKLFKGKEKEIESFSKKNSLSCKEEKDLVKIFNYYNSL